VFFALLKPIAVAVHLQDMNVVGQPVEQGAGQPLGGEHAGPLVERQVGDDESGAALVALRETSKRSSAPVSDSGTKPGSSMIRSFNPARAPEPACSVAAGVPTPRCSVYKMR